MSDKKYWTSFAALNNKEKLQKLTEDEFGEELPFGDLDGKGVLDAKTPRRSVQSWALPQNHFHFCAWDGAGGAYHKDQALKPGLSERFPPL